MKSLLLKSIWVIFASGIGSGYMCLIADFMITSWSWGFPRTVDITTSIVLAIMYLGFGSIIVIALHEMRSEIK